MASDNFFNVEDQEVTGERKNPITRRLQLTYKDYWLQSTKDIKALTEKNIALKVENEKLKELLDVVEKDLACYQTDGLTGLASRKRFDILFEQQVRFFTRVKKGEKVADCVVCIIDIDYFKQVNDTFGHLVGDAVLKALGGIIKAVTRDSDICGRYGGDELILVLPNCDYRQAALVCRSIINRIVMEESFLAGLNENGENTLKITLSIGMTKVFLQDTTESVIKRADNALYYVKEEGRNGLAVWFPNKEYKYVRYRKD